MKLKILILVFLLFTLSLNINGLNQRSEKVLLQLVYRGLESWHFSKKKIDDNFSISGFNEYIKFLDFNKRFFLKSDIDELSSFKYKIDDELSKGKPELMYAATAKVEKRVKSILELIDKIENRPFDFFKDEYITLDPDKRDYFSTEKEQNIFWEKLFKYDALSRYMTFVKTKKLSLKKIDKKTEEKVRKETYKSYRYSLNRMLKTFDKDETYLFINSLTRVFDPHTTYFPPKQLQDFDIEMTGKLEGIGALLGETQGFIKVIRIIPGGPSWKQKKLHAGDIILSVAQDKGTSVDISGMRIVDAVKFIRGKKGTKVTLTVKKPDGRIEKIAIIRDVVTLEETFAKSVIFTDLKRSAKYGYILLPGFYNDFKDRNGRKSSVDVKKEIIKLKKSNIAGLILDLRGNSGGALNDAIKLAGLFIKDGPILQTKSRYTGKKVINDPDPKIIFSKPLIVLVNALSASASEIVTSALQDYGRAVIVGGKHSFGKGTVQMMIDLNRFIRDKKLRSIPIGSFKITIQKFYRITGGSNQYLGVIPDIILPDKNDFLKIGEKYYDHPLKADSLEPVKFSKWNPNFDINTLRDLSKKRVSKDRVFKIIEKYIERIKRINQNKKISLMLEDALLKKEKLKKEMDKLGKKSECLLEFTPESTIKNNTYKSDNLKKIASENETEWFKRIKSDPYINESLKILRDMINGSSEKVDSKK